MIPRISLEAVLQIAPNVRVIPVGAGPSNVYLVVGRRAAFIDAGYADDDSVTAIIDAWREAGSPEVAAIVLTHRHSDHIGGAARLAQTTGAELVATAEEKPHIDQRLTGDLAVREVADGETLDLGGATIEFVHSPGHTMGSLCAFYREQAVLFTGDTVLGGSSTSINPAQGDMARFLDSVKKLLTCNARVIAPGHGPAIMDPKRNLEDLIGRRLERERQVLDTLGRRPASVDELRRELYAGLEPNLHRAAGNQLASHLVKLVREGKVLAPSTESGSYSLP